MTIITENPPVQDATPLSPADRKRIRKQIQRGRWKEWLMFDSTWGKRLLAQMQYRKAMLQSVRGQKMASWQTLMQLHRAALSPRIDRKIVARMNQAIADGTLSQLLTAYVDETKSTPRTQKLFDQPESVLGPHATVLKTAFAGEKGVLLLNYSYIYVPFAKLYDLQRISQKYYIVLEPSWSGTCDEQILVYGFLPNTVFVQCSEPRDIRFLQEANVNMVPIPTAANWWVDDNLYSPLPDVEKDADLVMVASWAEFKRHAQFFEVLAQLRQQGIRLKTLLAGYTSGWTKKHIEELAAYYGIADQLEIHEWIPPEEVNQLYNRALINVVWSRREGSNRAIIEGNLANIPFILREGFNYGDVHPCVNSQTGVFANDRTLAATITQTLERLSEFSPRSWVLENMTHRHATTILEQEIGKVAHHNGESWTGTLAGHMSVLHGNQYLDENDRTRFSQDYDFLRTTIR
ncbi:MAG: glycosyltransferase [Zavarzinella sp.]